MKMYLVGLTILTLFAVSLELVFQMSLLTKLLVFMGLILFLISPFFVYAIRTLWHAVCLMIFSKPDPSNFLKEDVYSGMVTPSDLDVFFHMNNSRYKRELDFARLAFYHKSGMMRLYKHTGKPYPLLVASTGRYRKSLTLFQKYQILTKIVYWDDQKFYFEQKFVAKYKEHKEFVYNINLLAFKTTGWKPEELISQLLSYLPDRPTLTEEIENFIKYNEASSLTLRNEIKSE